MTWSGFGQTHICGKQSGVQLRIIRPCSSRTRQPVRYQFPTIRLGRVLPQTARIILYNPPPRSGLVLADFVRSVWPKGSGPEASRCARIIRPVRFRAGQGGMRIVSGMPYWEDWGYTECRSGEQDGVVHCQSHLAAVPQLGIVTKALFSLV